MANSQRPLFAHRHNPDDSYDAICTKCLKTIATEKNVVDLRKAEAAHICPGFHLGDVLHPFDKE